MKSISSIILAFYSFFCFSQEFGDHLLTINQETLPQVFVLENSFFLQKYGSSNFSESLGITSQNYWNPVSMEDAINKKEAYLNRKNTTSKTINAETLGFRKTLKKKSNIRLEQNQIYYPNSHRVRNSVYRDARLPLFYDSYFYRQNAPAQF